MSGKSKHAEEEGGKPNPLIAVGIALVLIIGISVGASFLGSAGSPSLENCKDKQDPILVMECLEQFCSFDIKTCQVNCPLGYEMDGEGCPKSCECASSGLREFDVQFNEEDVPQILEDYSDDTDDVMVETGNGRSLSASSRNADAEAAAAFELFMGSATSDKNKLWLTNRDKGDPGRKIKIPYKIDNTMPSDHKSVIEEALEQFRTKTCVDFIPFDDKNEDHKLWHLVFEYGRGCWSSIGKVRTKGQKVSIGEDCANVGTIQHELMHAIGFHHEQARPDRDSYVKVDYENIKPNRVSSFRKMGEKNVLDLNSPYDVNSVTHFDGYVFAEDKTKPTIINLKTNEAVKAQNNGFSDEDVNEINTLYTCEPVSSSAQWAEWNPWSDLSATCGKADRYRFRKCLLNGEGASGCQGHRAEASSEMLVDCSEPLADDTGPQWGEWTPWSPCNKKCGQGYKWKTRPCGGVDYGRGCKPGKRYELLTCNTHLCPGAQGEWTEWSSWTECSETCRNGFKYQESKCLDDKKELSVNCQGGQHGRRYRNQGCNIGMEDCFPQGMPTQGGQQQGQQQNNQGQNNQQSGRSFGLSSNASSASQRNYWNFEDSTDDDDTASSSPWGQPSYFSDIEMGSATSWSSIWDNGDTDTESSWPWDDPMDYSGTGGSSLSSSAWTSSWNTADTEGAFIIPEDQYSSMCDKGDGYYTFGDFNNDGIDDVICSVTSTTFSQYFVGSSGPIEVWRGELSGCQDPHQRFIEDINGDGNPDFICHSSNEMSESATFVKFTNQRGMLDNSRTWVLEICTEGRIVMTQGEGDTSSHIACQLDSGVTEYNFTQ